ncbi:MAG: hypothetical protein AB2A00_21065 [Myxococcota bacterium]
MQRLLVMTLAATASLMACAEWKTGGNIGGANQGVRAAGNRQGGLALEEGEVAVSPDGSYFISLKDGRLVLGDVGGDRTRKPADLPAPTRVAFWPRGQGVFILSTATGTQTLASYDRGHDKVVWQREMPREDRWLDVTSDGSRLVLTDDSVLLVNAETGADVSTYRPSAFTVRDVDLTSDGQHVIITEETSAGATTTISIRKTDDGSAVCTTEAQNCADELVLSSDETRAFLAPTLCQQDPVTVIALGKDCKVEKQLPGFGPVALSPDGKTAVAFLDRDAVDAQAAQIPQEVRGSNVRYHLMFIDTQSLTFTTQPESGALPRYAFVPDGRSLLMDLPMDVMAQAAVLDLASGERRTVDGPPVKLHAFAFSSDSQTAFLLDGGIFELDVAGATLRPIPLPFIPRTMNITPDGTTLLLGNEVAVHFLDVATRTEKGRAAY